MSDHKPCPRVGANHVCISPGPNPDGRCCRLIAPGPVKHFSIGYRNPGHWDIVTREGRAFRIRGEAPHVIVLDEREDAGRRHPRAEVCFRTVSMAVAWCADELMLNDRTPT